MEPLPWTSSLVVPDLVSVQMAVKHVWMSYSVVMPWDNHFVRVCHEDKEGHEDVKEWQFSITFFFNSELNFGSMLLKWSSRSRVLSVTAVEVSSTYRFQKGSSRSKDRCQGTFFNIFHDKIGNNY